MSYEAESNEERAQHIGDAVRTNMQVWGAMCGENETIGHISLPLAFLWTKGAPDEFELAYGPVHFSGPEKANNIEVDSLTLTITVLRDIADHLERGNSDEPTDGT